jgi:[NiFe] hydrogenase diaphorase moiety small subunit
MSETITLTIDGATIAARPGQSVLEAADDAGIYIPRLCFLKGLSPAGACRVCTVRINGRPLAACTQPAQPGMFIESDTDELRRMRRDVIDMLFVEGNHFCMICEKSGACELQALAYRFGITAPKYPYQFPRRSIDATHPHILIDRDRCILCGRCARASQEQDGKHVFGFMGRGSRKLLAVNAPGGLGGTEAAASDHAVASCPTGSLLVRQTAFGVPVGMRRFDHNQIGADVEARSEKS